MHSFFGTIISTDRVNRRQIDTNLKRRSLLKLALKVGQKHFSEFGKVVGLLFDAYFLKFYHFRGKIIYANVKMDSVCCVFGHCGWYRLQSVGSKPQHASSTSPAAAIRAAPRRFRFAPPFAVAPLYFRTDEKAA